MAKQKIIELKNVEKHYKMGESVVRALAFSFIVGAVSGVLPAMQAAKLKPADALRYE